MKLSDLVFIGIRGSVVALYRATGAEAWTTHLKGANFVNVVVEPDRILAAAQGEIFCLAPYTGEVLWHNRLKGYGMGLAAIASVNNPGGGGATLAQEQQMRDAAAAAAASA